MAPSRSYSRWPAACLPQQGATRRCMSRAVPFASGVGRVPTGWSPGRGMPEARGSPPHRRSTSAATPPGPHPRRRQPGRRSGRRCQRGGLDGRRKDRPDRGSPPDDCPRCRPDAADQEALPKPTSPPQPHDVLIVTHAAPGSELEVALGIVQKPLETTLHPPPNTLRVYNIRPTL